MGLCYKLWPAPGLGAMPKNFISALPFLISVAAFKELTLFHVFTVTK